MENKKSRIIKWSLIVGIVIVLNLFFNYALSLVFQAPDYNTFCMQEQVVPTINNQTLCVSAGGQWNGGTPGYCNSQFTCSNKYQAAQNVYERNVFVSLVALGVIIIIASAFIKGVEVLSLSLSLGGVLSFIIASMRYWSSADNFIKVAILGVALVGLIWLAIKKFKD
ncbi:MAG TPA: hypothetical protein VMR73_01010 [Candidatus Paceibacterota bacterium]|nr:hypothetical protein [Candidatus Paceibacterota bacterium]